VRVKNSKNEKIRGYQTKKKKERNYPADQDTGFAVDNKHNK
jgi:hypothetical protein